jgi:diguanylate cyclase (GGDEF)-like protein
VAGSSAARQPKDSKQGAAPVRSTLAPASLRSRWNRDLAILFAVVLGVGLANFAGTRVLSDMFRHTATSTETEDTVLARLRADVAAHSSAAHGIIDGAQVDQGQFAAGEASTRADFALAIGEAQTAGGRHLLEEGLTAWQTTLAADVPLDASTPLSERLRQHRALSDSIDEVAAVIDRGSAADRAAVRSELARADDVEGAATVARLVLGLLVCGLMFRFARRLSSEVLRPVGALVDSANRLAAGDLDHRVQVSQPNELGDLAESFNAMAGAIAGSQQSLSRQANHDSLTGLANRAAFQARLQSALARPERRRGTQAVLLVDLDDFKDVNDTLGHAAGDKLLTVVAGRLREAVRPGDLVARLGGDEFALLLDDVSESGAALDVAQRVVVALAAPLEIDATWVRVGASVGLALRHDGSDPEGLMREADVAMYTAKGRGKNRVEHYDASLSDALVEHHGLKTEVAGAAPRGELVLDYQPIVDLVTGTFVGVEALVRWQHPTRGLLAPSAFVPAAEETGAIAGIGAWVLDTAGRQLHHWQRRYGIPHLWLSVNVSVHQLHDPRFAGDVADGLRRTGLAPTSLVLEVTESVLADPAGGAAGSLETLRQTGVRVALDDFGTGYCSLRYLRELPVDILKIDRSFVSGGNANSPGDLLLEAIVGLGQRLGLDVIPEGIEAPDQLARLQALGCRAGQGFLLARPMPAVAIDQFLAAPAPPTLDLAEIDPSAQPV